MTRGALGRQWVIFFVGVRRVLNLGGEWTVIVDSNTRPGFRHFSHSGPVLVAQGILDPLNDAKGRAALLQAAWEDVEVVEIEGGHCVHDERPQETCAAMAAFVTRVLGSGKEGGKGGREEEVALPVVTGAGGR